MRYDAAFVNGSWVAVTGPAADLVDPATEEPFATLRLAGRSEVDASVAAARAAFPAWQAADRTGVLRRVRDGIAARRAEFAAHITQDMGCPPKIADAVQVGAPLAVLDGFLSNVDRAEEKLGHSLVVREPVGVVAAITPWNYRCTRSSRSSHRPCSPAARWCSSRASWRPPPRCCWPRSSPKPDCRRACATSSSAPARRSAALAAHPGVDMVSFTGSTAAGRLVGRAAAETVKRVALELGGKSASVLLPDADLSKAVKATVNNAFLNSGQTCTAWTRLLVRRDQHDEVAALAGRFAEGMAGRLGPVASRAQWDRVQGYLTSAKASLVTGGPGRLDGHDRGYFCRPTVYADVPRDAPIAQEEIFGPVLSIIPYTDEDDALAIANGTPYGLAGAVWSADREAAVAFARRMRTGQVDINGARFNPIAPFGGYAQSGIGRELGPYGLDEYYELKSIQLDEQP